jgi:hypothetical protein
MPDILIIGVDILIVAVFIATLTWLVRSYRK